MGLLGPSPAPVSSPGLGGATKPQKPGESGPVLSVSMGPLKPEHPLLRLPVTL